ncbi:50S ribosomal protein L25 [Dethiosulfatarculus sandiegensis]|uniref:Large ribosomal subunit protein bL25 n=1 Tax=Dethiosulfatarculus sandiegensis TaxID=1429043 RepID=A0A0D2JCM2_9BACT|nr:50S ribosomal protein L25 [Dethiosulfatarculus sandiegensis]
MSVTRREVTGKGACRRLRVQGMIPAVVYGKGLDPENLAVPRPALEALLRKASGTMAYLSLQIEGESPRAALLQELQTDYLGSKPVHLDLYEIKPDQEITVETHLEFDGEAPGANLGGIVTFAEHSVMIKGNADSIPDKLVVDLSSLNLGESISASDLNLPEGVSFAVQEDFLVVSCVEPTEAAEETEEEEGEETEEGEAASEASE